MTSFLICTGILIFAILIGMPIAFAIGGTSLIFVLMTNPMNMISVPLRIFAGVDSFILMALPLFVLAADIMVKSGISEKLFDFVRLQFGKFRGGLAVVNILAGTVFGSISGAALSDVAALGTVGITSMEQDGYKKDFACAVVASASLQSPLIPPSNIAILYGGIMSVSVGALFLAGVVPGLLLAGGEILYILLMARKLNLPIDDRVYSREEKIRIMRDGIITMLMPAIILVGILGGFFTPTEAAAVAVFYAVVVGGLVFKTMTLNHILEALWNSAKTSANLFVIIGFSSVFAWTMGLEQIPDQIAKFMLSLSSNPYTLLLAVNVILIIVGMWMETGAAVILFGPILAPILYKVGIHPIHFAMVMITNLVLGLVTPPVGVVLYATAAVGKEKFSNVVRAAAPFILIGFGVVILVTYFPQLVLFLPRLAGLTN